MFKHFLVPLDGSRLAEAALPAAAFLADKLGARVTLFHVVEKNAPSEVHGQSHLRNAEDAGAYLRRLSQRAFPPGTVVDCHVHAAEADDVADSIVAHADELEHDLVIMCSHGRGQALHLFLGSIAQKVIALGSRPVLITHPDDQGGAPAFACNNILVPLDGDADHAQALPVSEEIARACGGALHLMMVIPRFASLSGTAKVSSRMLPATTSRILEMASQDARETFREQLETLRRQGFTASAHVLRGDPAQTIAKAASHARVDLIVLATHGKTGMEAFWAGSVTHRICTLSKISLLLIPLPKA
ncbi:universal stress protein [Oryzomonas japonica]|uniref:Universal stress protein n=1 Tax=Oryzomonas japonica TaxID=2603858 RepID=A0A7J4ZUA5_9BACT|nr:universal stress protein [Oryzomonas japonica]KAB0667216.1 universal stress protein [Oryzomonas japonica]